MGYLSNFGTIRELTQEWLCVAKVPPLSTGKTFDEVLLAKRVKTSGSFPKLNSNDSNDSNAGGGGRGFFFFFFL
jgi:hypothetical protein